MTLIKSISGIRGTIGGKVGDNLTPVDAVKFASAYGTFLKNNIKKEKAANTEIYTAILSKGTDRIYAAWWFDNGTVKSIDQLFWRWTGATGSKLFYLVNVNANNRKDLHHQVMQLLANQHYLTGKR